jgi:hypothetical protein
LSSALFGKKAFFIGLPDWRILLYIKEIGREVWIGFIRIVGASCEGTDASRRLI